MNASDVSPSRVPWPAVVAFILISCGLAWLVLLPAWLSGGLAHPLIGVLLPVMMMTPLVAAFLVTVIFRVPGKPVMRGLGWWPLRPWGRFWGMLAIALVLPIVVVAVTIALATLFGVITVDVENSAYIASVLQVVPDGTMLPPAALLVFAQILSIPLGALVNSFFTLGEETGWRGFLLPALRPLGTWPALVISGVIWGLWHAPVILLGYNFSRPDLSGLAFMVLGCVAWGVLLGWLRMRSGTVWPAVLAHGALNAAGGAVLLFAAADVPVDMAIVGPLGLIAVGVCAVIAVIVTVCGQMRWVTPDDARSQF